ncbi:MAG: hypothetical protein ISS61_04075 [Desulfobacteraceae bacterium]|nr:hypothetical protein [Desulfobacteraceae bacterium]
MYHNLHKINLDAELQKSITVYYDNKIVGEFVADTIVNDTVILGLKSVRRIIIDQQDKKNYHVHPVNPVKNSLKMEESHETIRAVDY